MESENNNHRKRFSSSIDSIKKAQRKSFKITLVYFILGSLWIIFSDRLMELLFTIHEELFLVSLIKGIFYVTVTTIILYLLIYYAFLSVFDSEIKLRAKNDELELSVSEYQKLYRQNENKQLLIKSLIDPIEDWIFYLDKDNKFLGCNLAFENFFDVKEEALVNDTDVAFNNPVFTQIYLAGAKCNKKDSADTKFEKTLTTSENKELIFEIIRSPYYDLNKEVYGTIYVGRDITKRKQQEDTLRYLNHHDVLTGIYNRSYLEEKRIEIDREENLPLSIIVCDVDGLKLVNDAFGHTAGDTLLKITTDILVQSSRREDLIIRTGGDEFCILLPRTSYQEAEMIQNAIHDKSREGKLTVENDLLYPSISTGCSTKTVSSTNFEEVFKEAEDYMYQHKLLARKGVHSMFLKYITTTIFEKSNETQEHCQRMSNMAKALGEQLQLPNRDLDTLELAASLHDIGKISIDLSILQKPERLNNDEWEIIKKHPETGWRIAQAVPDLYQISDIILYHHEHWDGTGYPRGLAGNAIPLMSRIISIVDSFDAMTQDRPYQKGISTNEAIEEIKKNIGKQFDPQLAQIFINKVLTSQVS